MAQGVYMDFRHGDGCPLREATAKERREGHRRCRCAPSVYVQVKRKWVLAGQLVKGWGTADYQEVEHKALGIKRAHDSGRRLVITNRPPTIRELAEPFLEDCELEPSYSPNTIQVYRSRWKSQLEARVGDLPVTKLNEAVIRELRSELSDQFSPDYVKALLTLLSSILTEKAMPQWMDVNPVRLGGRRKGRGATKNARPERRAVPLSFVRDLLATTHGLLHDMILCAVTTGMRQREIAGLKSEHVLFAERRIEVASQYLRTRKDRNPKSGDGRTTILCAALADRLAARAEHATGEYLFASVTGEPWSPQRQGELLNEAWERVAPRAKGDSWHVLRHTFSSLLDQHRVRPLVSDALMGHRNEGVSFRYRHVWDEDFDAVVELLDGMFPVGVPESAEVVAAADA